MFTPLTKKQKQILDYITEFIKMNGYAPSYREIAIYFGLSSPATVLEHIRTLEDKGYIQGKAKRSRSLHVLKQRLQERPSIELPLVGMIAAGEPIEATEERETIVVPSDLVRDPNSFVLKVRGDSMVEDGILNGDYVICERRFYPQNGEIVVALLNNEYATLKKYYREKNRIRLQPSNSGMKPLYTKNPAIQGIVRAVLRKY